MSLRAPRGASEIIHIVAVGEDEIAGRELIRGDPQQRDRAFSGDDAGAVVRRADAQIVEIGPVEIQHQLVFAKSEIGHRVPAVAGAEVEDIVALAPGQEIAAEFDSRIAVFRRRLRSFKRFKNSSIHLARRKGLFPRG